MVRGWLSQWPARSLEAQLRGRLAGIGLEREDESASPEEASASQQEAEDLSELWDAEDWAEDEEQEPPEEFESPDENGLASSERVDLLVHRLEGRWWVTSGLADVLLWLSQGSGLVRNFHLQLRLRIADSLALGRAVVAANENFLEGLADQPVRLPGPDLQQAAGLKEQRFSHLKNCLTLRTPGGGVMPLSDFVIDRTVDPQTDLTVLRLFIELLDEEVNQGAQSDQTWLERLDVGVGTKQAIGQSRKRLGIPDSRQRKVLYQEGARPEEVLRRIGTELKQPQREHLVDILRKLVGKLKNTLDRERTERWLGELLS